jgi:HK97 family phage portal protein
MRWPWQPKTEQKATASLESILRQIALLTETVSGISVTPDNCMRSPTVHSIVTAVSNRLAISPLQVLREGFNSDGRRVVERQSNHPVARLLKNPNAWQTTDDFVADAASTLVRWGRFVAFKGRGATGPIRFIDALEPGETEVVTETGSRSHFFRYKGTTIYSPSQVLYARLGARDYLRGDSPVVDVAESIALEIAAEKFGAAFFGNGALPLIYFQLMEGFSDFATDEEKVRFLEGVKAAFGGNKKFSTMMLPKGMELHSMKIENDKAQFIETRRFIRTVISGAFGVPPHLVGDLERATFNNVEQQDTDFIINVVLPIAKRLEAAMERDLLTQEDRNSGIIIRFDLDAVQRADIKTRNESLQLARDSGVINANEWREKIGLNPISEQDGGEDYIRPLNMGTADEEPNAEVNPVSD